MNKPTATEVLAQESESISTKLPPFLHDEIRRREAYLILIKDLTEHLGEDWSSKPEADAKKRISSAIARSLGMWI